MKETPAAFPNNYICLSCTPDRFITNSKESAVDLDISKLDLCWSEIPLEDSRTTVTGEYGLWPWHITPEHLNSHLGARRSAKSLPFSLNTKYVWRRLTFQISPAHLLFYYFTTDKVFSHVLGMWWKGEQELHQHCNFVNCPTWGLKIVVNSRNGSPARVVQWSSLSNTFAFILASEMLWTWLGSSQIATVGRWPFRNILHSVSEIPS